MNVDEIRHFLVIYDVAVGQAVVEEYEDYATALDAYESIEKKHFGREDLDIVLLGADSRATIEKTHSSYFQTTNGGFEQFFSDRLAPA